MTGYSPRKHLARECLLGALLLGWPLHANAAIYSVTSNADNGAGTLRQAILDANANPGADSILFNLPPGKQDIVLLSPLPKIVSPVNIDGTSQPGYTKAPAVTLRGTGSGSGLHLDASGSTVTALQLTGFENGLRATEPSCTIASCYVLSNSLAGIMLEAGGHTIRDCYAAANFIGMRLQTGETNSLFGNFIGIHPSTGVANGNSHGIMILAGRHVIGGTGADEGNVISGNTVAGIGIGHGSHSNSIRGNIIGANASGSTAVPNGVGLEISGSYNQVGDIKSGGGNLISGNLSAGIVLEGFTTFCAFNRIRGNVIGTDLIGTLAIPNGTGIVVRTFFAYSNTVGSAMAAGRNLISGNTGLGLYIAQAQGTTLHGNYIGTDTSGTAALPNGSHGVQVFAAVGTALGGSGPGEGNLISGNGDNGVYLLGPSLDDTTVEGNRIGVNAAGTHALGNGGSGIRVVFANDDVRIGGVTPGAGNTISGNDFGIYLSASDQVVVQGNLVGTTASGLAALGNNFQGITIHDSMSNLLGGVSAPAGNIVSGNGSDGIAFYGPFGAGNLVQGNFLGLGADGETPIPNGVSGLLLSGVRGVQVGGDLLAGGGNRISANGVIGVSVMNSSDCEFIGNWIGGHPVGAGFGGNAGTGMYITGSSSNNVIGGDIWSKGNAIAYNEGAGIAVGNAPDSVNTVGNRIDWNWIHHNGALGIDLGSDGPTPNDTVPGGDSDDGPNNLQNVPVITNVVAEGANLRIQGYLKSGVNQSYKINVYGNPQFDTSGYGEGEIMLGTINLSTAPLDTGYFDLTVPAPDPIPDYVAATATHLARGDTSEFSHFAMLDTDGDGMPDGWEDRHFGHPTAGDPDGHGDADGVTNLEEFLADTDPTDSESYLRIRSMEVHEDILGQSVTAATVSSSRYRQYRIEYSRIDWTTPGEGWAWLSGTAGYLPGTGADMSCEQAWPAETTGALVRVRARLP